MANLKIRIAGYTETVSVYVNDQLLKISSFLKDAKYTCTVFPGLCRVKIIKSSEILNSQWKKKVALNWLSSLSGIPEFTLREALLEANISSICFNINVTNIYETMDIKLILNSSGFKIIEGMEKCENVQSENRLDNIAMKRIKCFYLLPAILLSVVIIGFLIGIAVFFVIKAKIQLFLIVLALIIILSTLFIYLLKKSINK